MRILTVVGARPNLMKAAPLMESFRTDPDVDALLVHTGQHYDERLSGLFFEDLGLPRPDRFLGVGSGTHAQQTAAALVALEAAFIELEPDAVVVVGDVNSTVAGALAAAKLGIPVAHVEAGLRSFDRTMPEELNRLITDQLSDWLFTTESSGVENLRREGFPEERIHLVGNVMIDTLEVHRAHARDLDTPARMGLEARAYAIATLHRPSNVDGEDALRRSVALLEGAGRRLPVLFPVHPRTRRRLEEAGLAERLSGAGGVRIVEPLGYLEFLGLMDDARVVLTDSGGIQEETTALGVPCLTLRPNTERPSTLTEGSNRLVGTDPETVLGALDDVLAGPVRIEGRPALWDGRAATRIHAILADRRSPAAVPSGAAGPS